MARARRRGENGLDAWPGYVDALSTLLMVIIFVLLVFVLSQAFLSVALSGRDEALDKVNRQLSELSEMLALERGQVQELRLSMTQLNLDLQSVSAARDGVSQQLRALREAQARAMGERDAMRAERDRLAARLADTTAAAQAAAGRMEQLQAQLAEAAARQDAAGVVNSATVAELSDAQRQLMAMQAQLRALTALREELEKKAQEAAARVMTEAELKAAVAAQLTDERRLSESGRAQVALLTRQVEEMRAQLANVARALELAELAGRDKNVQIANLGSRLNAALAAKVEELQRYRSDFFGKLRDVLANRPGIQVVGDRFVFQSEVLFPVGSANLSGTGQEQLSALATTIREISGQIPAGVPWIMRVDGHADRQPLSPRSGYATNWELSAARAITVVKQLIAEGVPADHLAATGFGDNQPIDPADSAEAYGKNRRIELRLTDR